MINLSENQEQKLKHQNSNQLPADPFWNENEQENFLARFFKYHKLQSLTLLVILFFFLVFATRIIEKIKAPQAPPLLPASTPTPLVRKISTPSAYATDSAILKFEEEIYSIEKKIIETTLSESQLLLPVLDLNVKF